MTPDLRRDWDDLLVVFFGAVNRLDWPDGPDQLANLVARNEALLERTPSGPFVLPWAPHEGETTYVAFATDDSSGQELRRLLDGIVGPTYTTFDGRSLTGPSAEPPAAAARFAGDDRRVFLFSVAQKGDRGRARGQVDLLLHLLDQRPDRRVAAEVPIGRLIRDFERALRSGDEPTAKALLWKRLIPSGELSGLNRWFLEVRYLAAFEHWRELDLHTALDDLLRVARPALVSDALAQLAIHLLDQARTDGGSGSLQARITTFGEHVSGRFGALVPTVDAIRSDVGSEYYVLWQLTHGDDLEVIRGRLAGLAWGDSECLTPYWNQVAPATTSPPEPAQVFESEAAGQYERALELVAELDPDPELLPVVIRTTQRLLTRAAFDQADRYREALGDAVVDEALQNPLVPAAPAAANGVLERRSWPDRVLDVLAGERSSAAFEADVDEGALVDLLGDQDELAELADALHDAAGEDRAGHLVDGSIRLLRRLDAASGPSTADAVHRLRRVVLDLWALGDESGDLGRAQDILDEVERTFDDGISVLEFGDLVELLHARWTPFLTDRAFGLSVRAIEIMAGSRSPDDHDLANFAANVFQRITPANLSRLDPADLFVAESLSDELALGLDFRSLLETVEVAAPGAQSVALDTVGLYSLDEGATARARDVLTARIPGLEVLIDHSKVATHRLRSLVQRVDLMVVADRTAKHAATDAIRSARGSRPLVYAAGKGSSSLVRAALDYINEPSEGRAA